MNGRDDELRNRPHCANGGEFTSMIRVSIMEMWIGDLTILPRRHRGLVALEWTSANKEARQRAAGTSCDSFEGDQDNAKVDTRRWKNAEETTIHIYNVLGPVGKAQKLKRDIGQVVMVVVNSSARPA